MGCTPVCLCSFGHTLAGAAYACPWTPVQLAGPIAWQGLYPLPFISVDCGQQAGLEPGSGGWASGSIRWRWHQAGESPDDLGRLGREGPALPQDEELINLMN